MTQIKQNLPFDITPQLLVRVIDNLMEADEDYGEMIRQVVKRYKKAAIKEKRILHSLKYKKRKELKVIEYELNEEIENMTSLFSNLKMKIRDLPDDKRVTMIRYFLEILSLRES